MAFKCTFHIRTFPSWSLPLWWNDGYLQNLALYQIKDNKIEGKGLELEPVLKNPTLAPAKIAKLWLHHSGSTTLSKTNPLNHENIEYSRFGKVLCYSDMFGMKKAGRVLIQWWPQITHFN